MGTLIWRITPANGTDYYAAGWEGNWFASDLEATEAIAAIQREEPWARGVAWRVDAVSLESLSSDDWDWAWPVLLDDE